MAVRIEGEAVVKVNGADANQELTQLKDQASDLRKKITALNKQEVVDPKKLAALKKQLKNVNQETRSLQKTSYDYKKTLDNLSGASLMELTKASRKLNFETKSLSRNTKEYIEKSAKLKLVQNEISKVRTQMRGASSDSRSWFTKLNNGFNNYSAIAISFAASFTGIILGFREANKAAQEYEERVDNLSALTKLQGEELDYLAQASKEMSVSMTEDGVRIKQSADDIVDAFTLMGSKRPELLKNKEALRAVTEDAIILSEAGKTKLEPATKSLATAMNKFNASADESRRFINVLGAGSQAGAGNIEYLGEVVEKSGTQAKKAGLTIEQLVGITETIAPQFEKSSVAGTSLRSIFQRLAVGADEYNPKIVGLEKALENLDNANLSATEMQALFGKEHETAASILIDGRDQVDLYTKAVTGSNTAVEQAIINTGNAAASLAQAKNKIHLNTIELGEKLNPAMLISTNLFNYLLKLIIHVIDNFEIYKRILIVVTTGVVTYTLATKGAAIAQGLLSKATKVADAIMKSFNKTMKANPMALLITTLTTAIVAYLAFRGEVSATQQSVEKFNKELIKEKANLNNVFDALKKTEPGTKARKQLIDKINITYKDYLPNLLSEKSTLKEIKMAQENANKALEENLAIKAKASASEEILSTAIKKRASVTSQFLDMFTKGNKELTGEMSKTFNNWVNQAIKTGEVYGEEYQKFQEKFGNQNARWTAGRIKQILAAEEKKNKQLLEINATYSGYIRKQKEEDASIIEIDEGDPTEDDKKPTTIPGKLGKDAKLAKKAMQDLNAEIDNLLANAVAPDQKAVIIPELDEELEDENGSLDYLMKKFGGTTDGQRELLKAQYNINAISYEEYTDRLNEINRQAAEEQKALDDEVAANKLAGMQATLDAAGGLFSGLSALSSNFAKGQKAAVIFQLAADQASAISSLIKMSEGNPTNLLTGGIAGKLQFISGMIRIGTNFAKAFSTLNKAKEPAKRGYSDGGFTGSGGKYEPAGVVHKDEYVLPSEGLSNPTLSPLIDIIERSRLSGSLRTIDFAGVTQNLRGFAEGGYTSNIVNNTTQQAAQQSNTQLVAVVAELSNALNKFPRSVKANMSYYDFKEVADEVEDTSNEFNLS